MHVRHYLACRQRLRRLTQLTACLALDRLRVELHEDGGCRALLCHPEHPRLPTDAHCSVRIEGAATHYGCTCHPPTMAVLPTMADRLLSFLMNVHVENRLVYISRHGESMFNTQRTVVIPCHPCHPLSSLSILDPQRETTVSSHVVVRHADLIGGDSDLSPRGREYAKRLRTFMAK